MRDSTMEPMCILGTDFIRRKNLLAEYDGDAIVFGKKNEEHRGVLNVLATENNFRPDIYDVEVSSGTFLNTDVDQLDIGDARIPFKYITDIKSLFNNVYENGIRPIKPENLYSMKIELQVNKTFNFPPRRLSNSQKLEVESQINKLLQEGVIQDSNSSYASRIVLVKKKDNSWRICVDYRDLIKLRLKIDIQFHILKII